MQNLEGVELFICIYIVTVLAMGAGASTAVVADRSGGTKGVAVYTGRDEETYTEEQTDSFSTDISFRATDQDIEISKEIERKHMKPLLLMKGDGLEGVYAWHTVLLLNYIISKLRGESQDENTFTSESDTTILLELLADRSESTTVARCEILDRLIAIAKLIRSVGTRTATEILQHPVLLSVQQNLTGCTNCPLRLSQSA